MYLPFIASGDDCTVVITNSTSVTVNGDFDIEGDETVTFSLSVTGPDQAGTVSSVTLTITNDDGINSNNS